MRGQKRRWEVPGSRTLLGLIFTWRSVALQRVQTLGLEFHSNVSSNFPSDEIHKNLKINPYLRYPKIKIGTQRYFWIFCPKFTDRNVINITAARSIQMHFRTEKISKNLGEKIYSLLDEFL